MAHGQTTRLDPYTQACKDADFNIANNMYYFTFEGKAFPEEEEFGHLGFIEPYFAELNPKRPLGRPESDPSILPIPKLLRANCLDEDQYPWNILLSGPDSLKWDLKRYRLYQDFNVAAYKSQRSSNKSQRFPVIVYQDPPATQCAMSTVTRNALQTSYP